MRYRLVILATFCLTLFSDWSGIYASPALVTYGAGSQALVCQPRGGGPFPAVVYNHGRIVDLVGYMEALKRGYDMDGICKTLADDGYLAFMPIRTSGRGNIPGHKEEVARALEHVKTRLDVDPSRIALMGLSRGGLLTLMVGIERNDLKALIILAPAPGRGHFKMAVQRVHSLIHPVLLLVEAEDDARILENFEMLGQALKKHVKKAQIIRYNRGGGHRLFSKVDYYWKNVRAFLRETIP